MQHTRRFPEAERAKADQLYQEILDHDWTLCVYHQLSSLEYEIVYRDRA